MSTNKVCFRTDGAWDFLLNAGKIDFPVMDVREEAKGLRFITSAPRIEAFAAKHGADFRHFTLFGSGDFHHLSGIWTRQFQEPFTIVSFDNHPDWDVRPPKWSCGAWINRALENPRVADVSIWGCNNFECNFPGRLLGNRAAAKANKLLVHPWRQEKIEYPAWLHPVTSETWKARFAEWVQRYSGKNIYVTIDMDCLSVTEAATNWENGRFACDDLVWALGTLREKATIIGGDLCGAWSQPSYGTTFQKLAGWFDHPKVEPLSKEELNARNLRAFEQLWPALTR